MGWSQITNIKGPAGASGAQGASGEPRYSSHNQLIGDGSATAITVTHNLGTRAVHVAVYDAATWVEVECDVALPSTNTATLTFATAPANNAYSVAIIS